MKDLFTASALWIWGGIMALVLIAILAFGGTFMSQYLMPWREDIRRETFEGTKSFNDGMVRDLENLQAQYNAAGDAHKPGLRKVILHRATSIDEDRLPAHIRSFLDQLRRG